MKKAVRGSKLVPFIETLDLSELYFVSVFHDTRKSDHFFRFGM